MTRLDVILTPLKPPTKSNISSEAVNSSLYYLHVASDADEDVLRSIELENGQQQHDGHISGLPSETVSRLNDFHRKPVGGTAAAEPAPPAPPPHRELSQNTVIPRKPTTAVPDDAVSPTIISNPYSQAVEDRNQAPGCYHHGPPPGRNDGSNLYTIPRRPVSISDDPLSAAAPPGSIPSIQAPTQADYSYNYGRGRPRVNTENEYPSQERRTSPQLTEKEPSSSFRITVIRRDPASGHQWNVGTLSSFDEDKGSIHVEITNPGYGKFLNNEPFSMAAVRQNLPAAGQTENATAEAIKAMMRGAPRNDEPDGVFHREVVPIRHNPSAVGFHKRSGSADSRIADMANSKGSRGYYQFTSPWNGTCAFVASINGLGIKCKHIIPGPAMTGPHDNNNAEVTVSEIRFNMPFPLDQHFRSPLLSVWGEKGGKRGALAQMITSNIQKVQQARTRAGSESNPMRPPSASSSEDLTADEDRLDLSLAREPGGGGMSGRSAKLGKLIIEDEGIKMLDLVVAASMGVWWRSCHKSF